MNQIELLFKLKRIADGYNCATRLELREGYFTFDFSNRGSEAYELVRDCLEQLEILGAWDVGFLYQAWPNPFVVRVNFRAVKDLTTV
jgi:hypothetical protein